tara:strand:+ start:215 stop:1168 length:954 start_codon:yes stop_codon:yes gene_type:complete
MAVFTKLSKTEIENYLGLYDIGSLNQYSEIVEGIENTNYKIICNGTPYILTIFEKRVNEDDLPFFINLKLYLNQNNFKCPRPIQNRNGEIINSIKNKKAVIISFIEGNKIDKPNINECNEIGKMLGNLHNLTINFNESRQNSLDIKEWKNLLSKCTKNEDKKFDIILKEVENEIDFLESVWPKNIPSGVVHADLFKDNVFFKDEKITGVIDFYFSCYHFFLYDISIVINDWCFDSNGEIFNYEYYKAILNGYNEHKKITQQEIDSFNIILRSAAVRILVTRLHDYIFHPKDAIVLKKDPYQYYNILKWHQSNNIIKS